MIYFFAGIGALLTGVFIGRCFLWFIELHCKPSMPMDEFLRLRREQRNGQSN